MELETVVLSFSDREIEVEFYGGGPTVILVHGGSGLAASWRRIGELLADRFRIVAPNMTGVGRTTGWPKNLPVSMKYECELLEHLSTRLDEPCYLVGHSAGANIILSAALRGRMPITGLSAIEPVTLNLFAEAGAQDAYDEIAAVVGKYLNRDQQGWQEQAMVDISTYMLGPQSVDAMNEKLRKKMIYSMSNNIHLWRAIFDQTETISQYASFAKPTMIVIAENGPRVSKESGALLARTMPNCYVLQAPNCDHMLIATHPDLLAGHIASHIEEIRAAP